MLVSELEKKPESMMSSSSTVNSMLSGMSSKKEVFRVGMGSQFYDASPQKSRAQKNLKYQFRAEEGQH